MSYRRPVPLLVATALLVGAAAPALPLSAARAAEAAAPGQPGALSHFDLARKDCVGTARSGQSKVWFTVANGVLSDVYSPTIDNTNVESLQYVVTDGRSFTDLQTRDLTYTVTADSTGMACTVTATSASHGYRLVTTYAADPARASVLLHTRLVAAPGTHRRGLRLYVRFDPTINGNGGGGSDNGGADTAVVDTSTGAPVPVAYDTTTVTNAVNRDYAVPVYAALRADRPFAAASVGYAGTASDGLAALDASHALRPTYAAAPAGNVVATAAVRPGRSGIATLALGFGRTRAAALRTAGASARAPFRRTLADYRRGWTAYDRGLRRPPARVPGLDAAQVRRVRAAYYLSANVLRASEDKTFPGAIVASLASPWGQAVSAGALVGGRAVYFGSYREVFARDLYEAFTGLLSDGDRATARAATRFLFERQQLADGRMPRNSLLNGQVAPDTGGDQLDETAYPILMARQAGLDRDRRLYRDHIRRAGDFLVAHGPAYGVERWEEQSGYSPSTIAAEIAGLVAAGAIADRNHDPARARLYRATADDFRRHVQAWTVTTTGPYAARYFLRLSKNGDPNEALSYGLGNGGPTADQRSVVDQGFLELTRLGILRPHDPDVVRSLPVVDRVLRRTTPSGPGFYRYGVDTPGTEDGYGDCWEPDPTDCAPSGKPWPTGNAGSGHLWPVLSGERAEQALQTGHVRNAAALLVAMDRYAAGVGLVPEQDWEDPPLPADPYGTPPETASIGFAPGRPAGSAAPLTWAQAQEARLVLSLGAGRPVEQPTDTRRRYLDHRPPGAAPLTVTAPTDGASVTASTTTVTGTTAPDARVDVLAANTDTGAPATLVSVRAGSDGTFTAKVPTTFGTTVITVTATTARGATAYAQVRVVSDVVTGTTVLDASDPAGDDNGPGTYAYPTAADFHPGAFDIERFQVIDAGDTVYLRLRTRDLTPTFGNPIGAQLLDVYVHTPGAAARSTAAAYSSRNYSIAPNDAWSRRIEVQGFAAPVFVDAAGNPLGGVAVRASEASRTITMAVAKAAFGTPGAGWSFVVTLHGQDGFSPDQARGFTPTPTGYTFGVCPDASTSSPICAVDPSAVPKVMDTITPAGVSQATELDPTMPPVQLVGVPVG